MTTETTIQAPTKEQLLEALYAWVRQRPGLDYGNYGDVSRYRAELRQIQKDLDHARILLSAVSRSSITGEELLKAFSAFSGRMEWRNGQLDYTTGQYWPTEYRKVVCAIAAQALWHYKREYCMPAPDEQWHYNGLSAGDFLRQSFRKEFGNGIQTRWFN